MIEIEGLNCVSGCDIHDGKRVMSNVRRNAMILQRT